MSKPLDVAGMYGVIGIAVLASGSVASQDFPIKPLRIVTQNVGGSGDFAARLIASGISGPLGQQVVVENRTTIGAVEAVAKASPDGYAILLTGSSFWIAPLLESMPYDPVKEFAAITITHNQPNVLVVHPSLPVKSVKDLVALARARPGQLNYSTGGMGSSSHLAGELFNAMAGVKIVRVAYRGSSAGTLALIGGEVHLMFPNAAAVASHVKSGKLRALAVTTSQPSALLPGLPTVAAAAVPGYESAGMTSMFAPAKTPVAIINRLNQEIVRFLATAAAKERFFNAGAEVVGSSPDALAATMKSEMARLSKVIKDAGIRAE